MNIDELNIGGYIDRSEIGKETKAQIISDIRVIEGKFGTEYIFNIRTENDLEGSMRMNTTSLTILRDSFGKETTDWVGKDILLVKRDLEINKEINTIVLAFPADADSGEVDKQFRKMQHITQSIRKKAQKEEEKVINMDE